MNQYPNVDIQEVLLHEFQIRRSMAFEKDLPSLDLIQCYSDHMFNLMAEVRANVYGTEKELPKIQYPSTWWDAFKERFFPKWAKEKWPVKYTDIAIVLKELYPKVVPSVPGECVTVKFLANNQTVLQKHVDFSQE
jgi:hypothetical protein